MQINRSDWKLEDFGINSKTAQIVDVNWETECYDKYSFGSEPVSFMIGQTIVTVKFRMQRNSVPHSPGPFRRVVTRMCSECNKFVKSDYTGFSCPHCGAQ